MKTKSLILSLIVCLLLNNCKEKNRFPTEKKYWDVADYDMVIREIKYNVKPGEKLATFDNPETKLALEKLTDEENFKVVLDDKQLGLKHKSEVAKGFFDVMRDMNGIYRETDRTDKYVYEKELLEILNFGLELQIRYFKLGNDLIIAEADDSKSENVKNTVNSNVNTLVKNMTIYLDEINNEKSFSNEGLVLLANAIDKNFAELIKVYPDFNYEGLLEKVNLMLNKTKSGNVKESLNKLKMLIESKKQVPATEKTGL